MSWSGSLFVNEDECQHKNVLYISTLENYKLMNKHQQKSWCELVRISVE